MFVRSQETHLAGKENNVLPKKLSSGENECMNAFPSFTDVY